MIFGEEKLSVSQRHNVIFRYTKRNNEMLQKVKAATQIANDEFFKGDLSNNKVMSSQAMCHLLCIMHIPYIT